MTKRLFLFICFLQLINLQLLASAPKSLIVPVVFTVENGNYELSYVVVKKNGEAVFTKSGEKNLKLKLEYGNEYLISFSKEGYITKQILFNTSLPEGVDTTALEPYKIGVRIFKQYEGVNIVIYNQPVGFIHFMAEEEGFGYDTDYTKSILSELESVEKQLLEKSVKEKERIKQELKLEKNDNDDIKDNEVANSKTDSTKENTNKKILFENKVGADSSNASLIDKSKSNTNSEGQDYPSNNLYSDTDKEEKNSISIRNDGDTLQSNLFIASGDEPISQTTTVLPETEIVIREIKEKNRTITEVELYTLETKSIIRKVVYSWGGVFYYGDNNKLITENQFYYVIRNYKKR